ncbi:acylphosphatase [Enterobacteriaceae bacterium ESL0689]|nr:acylphosphatase [Enterobacteriaceae bacterium ESL0689]
MPAVCMMIKVYGSVQGVGFRYFTQQAALRLGLTGYVRNLADGSVEALACGEREQIMKLITCLEAGGPRYAKVDKVSQQPCRPTTGWETFSVYY